MNQNHHFSSPDCAAFAPLLPLAEQQLLSKPEDARLRAHVAACAHCQAELRVYAAAEEALRRSFAPGQGASPPFSREELMEIIDHQTDQSIDQSAPSAPPIIPATPPRRSRRFLAGFPALAAVLAIVLIAVLLFATRGTPAPGLNNANSVTVTPTPIRGSDTELHSVSMVSPTEGWAIGYAIPADGPNAATALLMHYAHGVWSRVPTTVQGRFTSISMDSPTDGWAVSDEGVMLHFDGKTWRQAASPTQRSLLAVQMLSATDGWAIGGLAGGVILHYDGHRWTSQPLPASLGPDVINNVVFESLSMISPTEGWIVGETIPQASAQAPDGSYYPTEPPNALILHYANGAWTMQQIIEGATLRTVSMVSATDGWAAGDTDTYTQTNGGGRPGTSVRTAGLLLHYTGGAWTKVANPLATPYGKYEGILMEVVLTSPTDGWLVGEPLGDTPGLLRYNGSDWTPVSLPAASSFKDDTRFYNIFSIAMTSATEGWAVGDKISTEAGGIPLNGSYQPTITPLILHYHNGTWSAA